MKIFKSLAIALALLAAFLWNAPALGQTSNTRSY